MLFRSDKARQVIHLIRPCADKKGFHFYSSFKDDDHGFFAKIASWRVSNSALPAFLDVELFYQLGNVGFNPVQVLIFKLLARRIKKRGFFAAVCMELQYGKVLE